MYVEDSPVKPVCEEEEEQAASHSSGYGSSKQIYGESPVPRL